MHRARCEGHCTQRWGGRGNREPAVARGPEAGLRGHVRSDREQEVRPENCLHRDHGPQGAVASTEASGQALSSTGKAGRAGHKPGGPPRWMITERARSLLQTVITTV